MTQIVTTEFAEPGARFEPDVFDSQVDKELPLRVGGDLMTCTLLGYSVAEDGSFVTLTLSVPSELFETDVRGLALSEGR